MKSQKEIDNGWGFDPYAGTIFYFGHIPAKKARQLMSQKKWTYVVETINWVIAHNDEKMVHLNQYFADNLDEAVALAIKKQIEHLTVGEEFLRIRRATVDEAMMQSKLHKYYYENTPDVLSEEEAKNLPSPYSILISP